MYAGHSVASWSMRRILGGLKGRLALWSLTRPGRDHDTMPVQLQGRQAGIVSAIDCAPQGDLLAAGTFTALIAMFDVRSFEQVSSMLGHAHGIVQLKFSRYVLHAIHLLFVM